jgi:hypothetical protein
MNLEGWRTDDRFGSLPDAGWLAEMVIMVAGVPAGSHQAGSHDQVSTVRLQSFTTDATINANTGGIQA